MLSILYNIIISPIELVVEVVFELMWRIVGRHETDLGLAVIGVSVAVSLLTLPLYRRADVVQQKERDTQKRLSHWVSHIKRTFKGDERFMMLHAYYRENGYSPLYALRGTLSLLLEIPFFIAAYHFLSHLDVLRGASFGFISDLGKPDGLGWGGVNILPILMTMINCVSASIYLKGFPAKDKVQTYGMALIFLVLLYNSPAGLVVYWTCNNIFSLVKNVFYKLKNPRKVAVILCAALGTLLTLALFMSGVLNSRKKYAAVLLFQYAALLPLILRLAKNAAVAEQTRRFLKNIFYKLKRTREVAYVMCAALGTLLTFALFMSGKLNSRKKYVAVLLFQYAALLPLFLYLIKDAAAIKRARNFFAHNDRFKTLDFNEKRIFLCFIFGSLNLALFTGLYLSSSLIASSPTEFAFVGEISNPIVFILINFAFFVGIFLFWPMVIYKLGNGVIKISLAMFFLVIFSVSLLDVFCFSIEYGQMDINFVINESIFKKINTSWLFIVFVFIFVFATFLFVNKKFIFFVLLSVAIAQIGYSVYKIGFIEKTYTEYAIAMGIKTSSFHSDTEYHLSKDKKNVIVIFLDRAVNDFFPYAIEEIPELRCQFKGFCYYPNTLSFGNTTLCGSPGLFGGYEYSMDKINERADTLLLEKHNEALLMMPTLFSEAGFKVTVSDPPFPNYKDGNDYSIYEGLKNTQIKSVEGKYAKKYKHEFSIETNPNENFKNCAKNIRNFIILQVLMPNFKASFYKNYMKQFIKNSSNGINRFINNFSTLFYLRDITDFDCDLDSFIFIDNETTHVENIYLNEEYTSPANTVHKGRYETDDETVIHHYQVNMASLKQLGLYFDYLRENDVYDNTRIIIVSDHAMYMRLHEFEHFGDGAKACIPAQLHCLLLFKDFNSIGELKTDFTFMTNADTLFLAKEGFEGISKINPFTHKELVQDKNNGVNVSNVQGTEWNWNIMRDRKQFTMPENNSYWYHVIPGDVYDKNNWIQHSEWEKQLR